MLPACPKILYRGWLMSDRDFNYDFYEIECGIKFDDDIVADEKTDTGTKRIGTKEGKTAG